MIPNFARKPNVSGSSPAAKYSGEFSAAITRLMFQCLRSGWKSYRGVKEKVYSFPCCPVYRECLWKKTQIEKKILLAKYFIIFAIILFPFLRIRLKIYIIWIFFQTKSSFMFSKQPTKRIWQYIRSLLVPFMSNFGLGRETLFSSICFIVHYPIIYYWFNLQEKRKK